MQVKILIVDDSPILRRAIKKTVIVAGADPELITEAGNGQEAIDALEKEQVDLILLDLNMPVMNGLEFIEEARKAPEGRALPMLLLTTEVAEHLKQRAREVGATGWLTKPFDPAQILRLVDQLA